MSLTASELSDIAQELGIMSDQLADMDCSDRDEVVKIVDPIHARLMELANKLGAST